MYENVNRFPFLDLALALKVLYFKKVDFHFPCSSFYQFYLFYQLAL